MRIIVGVDGSAGSLAAVRFVGQLLDEETDPLYLYYSPPDLGVAAQTHMDPETAKRVENSLVDAVFQRAKEQLPHAQRERVVTVQSSQRPKHGILESAEKYDADLIVAGMHGIRPLDWLRTGSVSRAIAQSSHVPVLVVRQPNDKPPADVFRVLVATDRTEFADHVKHFIQRFPWPARTEGDVMTVYENYLGEVPDWLQDTLARESGLPPGDGYEPFAADKQRVMEELNSWCADLPSNFRSQAARIVDGHPAQMIVDQLGAESYDLVVLGASHHSVVGRMLLGSTSYAVLNHAPCSVLIVHERDDE